MTTFADRRDAGRRLAEKLCRIPELSGPGVVVLGLPRGGVPVAAEVAYALGAPLDVIVVRKLGVPSQPELAMGAIGEDGVRLLDQQMVAEARVTAEQVAAVERRERNELELRVARLRGGRGRLDLTGRTAVIVDDGLATGATARVACAVARGLGARRVIVAVPVAPASSVALVSGTAGEGADQVVVVDLPPRFFAVSAFYRDFTATSDDEVVEVLDAARNAASTGPAGAGPVHREDRL
jgi:putative phosphoribosyl transferase